MPKRLLPSMVVCPEPDKTYPRIAYGEGIYLYDEAGKRYIDGSGGASAVTILGHGRAEIAKVLQEQATRVAIVPTHYFSTQTLEEYVEALVDFAPEGMSYAWTASGGSEAIENAIKLARQYQLMIGQDQRYKIIGRWQSYHGSTMGALDVSGATGRRTPFTPLMRHHPHIPPAYCYRCPFGKTRETCALDCAQALETVICQEGAETVAAFIAEPVVGAALGAVPAPQGYFQTVREICDRYGVLLIVDEVMTGFGRTGKNFAIEHWQVTPDIIASAKGMSGGYFPLGVVIANDRVVKPITDRGYSFLGGHTFACNPLGAAVGLYVLHYIQEHGLVERAMALGSYFLDKLRSLLDIDMVGDVRGLGLLVGIEFVSDTETKRPFSADIGIAKRVGEEALKRGLITYPGRGSFNGIAGDHVKLAPPLIIEEEQLDEIVDILRDAVVAVYMGLRGGNLPSQ